MKNFDEKAAQLKARLTNAPVTVVDYDAPLSVQEAALQWGRSVNVTRDFFRNVPGVRVIQHPYRFDSKKGRHVQKYDTVLIPPFVLQREIRKITNSA